MEKKRSRKIGKILKSNRFLLFLYRAVFGFIFRFIGLFVRVDNKKILFVSYGGDSFDDSPRVLFEQMSKDYFFNDYTFIWALNYDEKIEGASVIQIDTLKYFITALKAGVWITNVNIERGLSFKKKKTIYLNTWHGTPLKKAGNAVKGRNDYNFGNVDILCADGSYEKELFLKYFNAKEDNITLFGRPREDELYFEDIDHKKTTILSKLNIPSNKKIILYVPTWRNHRIDVSINKWLEFLGEDYYILVRSHHLDTNSFNNLPKKGYLNVSNYKNINDLYIVSDYLISDYSSAFFDFGLMKKPIFCLAPDYIDFYEKGYLFFDFSKSFPNGVFDNYLDMLKTLKDGDYGIESEKTFDFVSKYVSRPVNATNKCIALIKEKTNFKFED